MQHGSEGPEVTREQEYLEAQRSAKDGLHERTAERMATAERELAEHHAARREEADPGPGRGGPTEADLHRRFTHHPPNADDVRAYQHLRGLYLHLAREIVHVTPPGREQSVALTRLEDAMFWTNAARARRGQ
jgi:hypothetical protein